MRLVWLALFFWAVPILWADEVLVPAGTNPAELRGLAAAWEGGTLRIHGETAAKPTPSQGYAWATFAPSAGGWDLGRRAAVEATVTNTGDATTDLILWAVGDLGWDAVPSVAALKPGETTILSCDLRERYPDQTPKIDPRRVKRIQVMVTRRGGVAVSLALAGLKAAGEAPEWTPPPGRIEVPTVEDGPPAPGKRVRFRLPGGKSGAVYSILHLPEDWTPQGRYPVIAEFPGNIFFVAGCYSTGLPDQCVMGHGMTKGRGAICVGLPFVNADGTIAEHGWGDADATADHAMRMMDEVCGKHGGDRANLVMTGFSRGAIACGYIGLRNGRIASYWKGFHACQHYDGDGWNGATMEGALERAQRFRGKAVFQTDNAPKAFQPVMDRMKTEVTWVQSGLGAHATAMFLDDRPSTVQVREWFRRLVAP